MSWVLYLQIIGLMFITCVLASALIRTWGRAAYEEDEVPQCSQCRCGTKNDCPHFTAR